MNNFSSCVAFAALSKPWPSIRTCRVCWRVSRLVAYRSRRIDRVRSGYRPSYRYNVLLWLNGWSLWCLLISSQCVACTHLQQGLSETLPTTARVRPKSKSLSLNLNFGKSRPQVRNHRGTRKINTLTNWVTAIFFLFAPIFIIFF